jgi:allantoinase
MVPSGVDEFRHVGQGDLALAMPVLARLGLPLLVHAEAPAPIAVAEASLEGQDPRSYATYLASRPEAAERDAIRTVLDLCASTRCAVHVVHLSSAAAMADLRAAKASGLPVTVETCPHYLTLAAEDVSAGDTSYKCAPPIRARANRERLWQGLRAGAIDLVATDHSPCPPELKRLESGDFFAAWGGIVSLGLALPLLWAEARDRGVGIADLTAWLAERPARLAGLGARKGRIAPGHDADLVVWDPETEWRVDESRLHCRHRLTPYLGRRVRGEVRATYLRGRLVFERGAFVDPPSGIPLDRWGATV